MKRRDWGRVRQLPSGRWQARYPAPDGLLRTAPNTFERRKDAADWLAAKRVEISRDEWIDPDLAGISLRAFGERWIAERTLAETTRERYEFAFRRQILPMLGGLRLSDIREGTIRTWYAGLLSTGVSQGTAAKAYRLLHAIFATAQGDQLLRRNPCNIKGASLDRSAERIVLSIDEIFRIAGAIQPRYRVLVLLAAFTSLRFGELAALRRRDIDLMTNDVAVTRSQSELRGGRRLIKEPKSAAGIRSVTIPATIADELRRHLDEFVDPDHDAPVFVGPRGGILRRHNFRRIWLGALVDAGITRADVHFHDLRHTGNDLAAKAGASTRELMARMGHSSMRAALIYQHASRERDRQIAAQMDRDLAKLKPGPRPTKGPKGHAGGTTAEEAG